MKSRYQILAAALLLALPGVARAQATLTSEQRQALEDRRQQLEDHRQQVQQHRKELLQQRREQLKQQRDQLFARRHELMQELRDLQKQLREQVKSGQLTKDQAKDQLRAWRQGHKPTPGDGAKRPRPSNGDGA